MGKVSAGFRNVTVIIEDLESGLEILRKAIEGKIIFADRDLIKGFDVVDHCLQQPALRVIAFLLIEEVFRNICHLREKLADFLVD